MQGGGYMADDNSKNDGASSQKFRERGGLIPITAKILSDSTVNHEDAEEYQGILLSDVSIVGYLKAYNETDTKVLVTIWDETGKIETVFYNKGENETHSGLSLFHFTELNKLVKIFGTVKTYKKEKNLQGAKMEYVNDNVILHHKLEVVNDWLHLTNRVEKLTQMSSDNYNNEVKNLGNYNNNNNTGYSSNYNNTGYNNNAKSIGTSRSDFYSDNSSTDQIVLNTIREQTKRTNGRISRKDLFVSLEKKNLSHNQINSAIKNMNDNGYLLEEEDFYTLQA